MSSFSFNLSPSIFARLRRLRRLYRRCCRRRRCHHVRRCRRRRRDIRSHRTNLALVSC